MAGLDHLTRRRALTLGGASVAGLALPRLAPAGAASAQAALQHRRGSLPVSAIQSIIGAEGSVSAIHKNGLTFQAMHQHYFDLDPMVWFIHFRGAGKPRTLAHAVRGVLAATSTPLPQKPPAKPTTPLDHGKLAKTLHGSSEIADDGVVTVSVSRSDRIIIDDVQVSPEANISTNIEFLPLDAKGTKAAAAPDFSMTASEVEPVCRRMRAAGFEIGCLYNQETDEHPQLYFAHMLAVGDPQNLAVKIRKGLDLTNAD